jgi:transcriptional regulator with XRE-family HTH domain
MASDEKPGRSAGRPLGPTGETVRSNIRRIRQNQRIALTELSEKMGELGRPIPVLGIRRIEDGQRRVDADDLVALALALGVSPTSLLMPDVDNVDDEITITGLPESVSAGRAYSWFGGKVPITAAETHWASFVLHGRPRWEGSQANPAVAQALAEVTHALGAEEILKGARIAEIDQLIDSEYDKIAGHVTDIADKTQQHAELVDRATDLADKARKEDPDGDH